jgi:hypothetical protein
MNYPNLPLPPPEPRVPAANDKRPTISKKIRNAIALLLSGEPDIETAAKGAGISTLQFRQALKQHHVRQHLFAERRALVAAACAGNPAALVRLREGDNAAAAVKAAQVLEAMHLEDEQAPRGRSGEVSRPGLVIQINTPPAAQPGAGQTITINSSDSDPAPLPDPGPDLMIDGG